MLDPTLPYQLTSSAIVDDFGNQRLSEYLQTGAAFGTLIAPLLPQAGVVASGINVALQSDAAKKLSDETNRFSASKIGISGTPLVSLQPPQTSAWYEQNSNSRLLLQRYNYANRPYNEAPSDLGIMTIHVYRTATILGVDPITIGKTGSLPTYDNLSRQTQVFTLTSTAGSGMIVPNRVNAYDFLNQSAHTGDALASLPANATPGQVIEACGNWRNAIQNAGIFNRFDATALLWRVYSWSQYAASHEPRALGSALSPCLNQQEQSVVILLKIDGWPHQGVVATNRSSTRVAAL